MVNANSMFYSHEHEVVGKLVSADFIKDTFTLMDIYGNTYEANTNKLKELEKLGTLGDHVVFNHDVLLNNNSNSLFEVVKFEDGFRFHHLDENLERTGQIGNKGLEEHFTLVEDCLEILGNIFEMKKELEEKKAQEMDFDFNIKIYKADVGGKSTYYYAGNNKSKATIDLIKVIYMGHYLLEEEDYENNTYTYEQFQSLVNTGVIVESTPMELSGFVMGKFASASIATATYDSASPASYEEEEEEDFVLDFDFEDMPYKEEDCECKDSEESEQEKEERYQQELMEAVSQMVIEVISALATSGNTEPEPAPDTDAKPRHDTKTEAKSTEKDSDDIYLWD